MRRVKKVAFLAGLTGAGAGLLVSLAFPPLYTSTAVMALGPANADEPRHLSYRRLAALVLSRESLSAAIQSVHLYEGEPIDVAIGRMQRATAVTARTDTGNPADAATPFRIAFTYSDPRKAQAAVQNLVTRFIDEDRRHRRTSGNGPPAGTQGSPTERIDRLKARISLLEGGAASPSPSDPSVTGTFLYTNGLSVIDPPSLPASPASQERRTFILIGAAAGLAAAVIVSGFRPRLAATSRPAKLQLDVR